MAGEKAPLPTSGKELLQATAPFAVEDRPRSWRLFGSTYLILLAVLVLAAMAPWWPLRLAAAIVGGLIIVRSFILYHDFLHGSLLSDSRFAKCVFYLYGLLALTPSKHWRYSHNYHHAHVGKVIVSKPGTYPLLTADIGSFPLMTTEQWRNASLWHRLRYRVTRHPLTILGAYVTIFLLVGCVNPLIKQPRKYWDGILSLLAHCGLIAALWFLGGPDMALFAFVLPFAIAAALGSYLFYAQHTFDKLRILPPEDWNYYQGRWNRRPICALVHSCGGSLATLDIITCITVILTFRSIDCRRQWQPFPRCKIQLSPHFTRAIFYPAFVPICGILPSREWSVTARPGEATNDCRWRHVDSNCATRRGTTERAGGIRRRFRTEWPRSVADPGLPQTVRTGDIRLPGETSIRLPNCLSLVSSFGVGGVA